MRAGQKPRQGRIAFPSKRQAHLCDMDVSWYITLNSPWGFGNWTGREKGEVTRAMAKAEHRTATVD